MAEIITQQQYNDTVNKIRSYTKQEDLENSYILFRNEVIKTYIEYGKYPEGSSEYQLAILVNQIYCYWAANTVDRLIELGFYPDGNSTRNIGYAEADELCKKNNLSTDYCVSNVHDGIMAAYDRLRLGAKPDFAPEAPTAKVCNKWISLFLCVFLGYLGAHKFYEGKKIMGVVYILTAGIFCLGWFADVVALLKKPTYYEV